MKHRLLFICLLTVATSSFSQLLDDSTKAIYGGHSTYYFHERQVLEQDSSLFQEDTTLVTYHIWNYTYRKGTAYQDLGVLGSPQQSVFPEIKRNTGVRLGYDRNSAFVYQNEDIKYYDTKSPFSEMTYYQNVKGQEYFNGTFSRSAGENFNIGFQLTRFSAERQAGANTSEEGFMDVYNANAFTSIKGFKNKYRLLANFKYLDYETLENGGIFNDGDDNNADSLYDEFEQVNLSSVHAEDKRANYHLYHHFSFDSIGSLQLFQSFDRIKQRNYFTITDASVREETGLSNFDFFPGINIDSTQTRDSTVYTSYETVSGLKGRLGQLFYMGYAKLRTYDFNSLDSVETNISTGKEFYLGGELMRPLWKGALLRLEGELSEDGYLRSNSSLKSSLFDLNFNYLVAPADLLQTRLGNNHFQWDNDFSNVSTINLNATVKLEFDALKIQLKGDYLMNSDLVYYDQDVQPIQHNGSVGVTKVGAKIQYSLQKWVFTEESTFGASSNDAVIRIPSYFNHLQLAYRNSPKGKKYLVMIGLDVYSRGAYYAGAYMPMIQQFYLQDEIELKAYTWVDAFVSLRVKNARIFVKVPHVTQGVFGRGYQVTPYYTGTDRALELGFNWRFYN